MQKQVRTKKQIHTVLEKQKKTPSKTKRAQVLDKFVKEHLLTVEANHHKHLQTQYQFKKFVGNTNQHKCKTYKQVSIIIKKIHFLNDVWSIQNQH